MCGRGGDGLSEPRHHVQHAGRPLLAGEMEAEAGLYCLGRDMRNTTSLFFMLLCTASLSLAQPQPRSSHATGSHYPTP